VHRRSSAAILFLELRALIGQSNVGFSLGSAALWGAGDYSGGTATKMRDPFWVVFGAHGSGLVLSLCLALLAREPLPSATASLWAAFGGLSGGLALVAFYRSLAIGTMGINAPIAAVLTAVLPVIVSIHTEGAPKSLQVIGFLIGALSIILVSRPGRVQERPRGLGLAILSGFGFGFFLIGLNGAGKEHVFGPLTVARAASATMAGTIVLWRRRRDTQAGNSRQAMLLILAAGACDTLGNAMFMFASSHGRLDVAATLSSLYPVTTVLLAWVIDKERMHPVQAIGSVLALLAVPLIAG
jgi:drug/metabolite transporter (DMT)-like permease